MSYSFRLRFKVSDFVKLPFDEKIVSIYNSDTITINLHSGRADKSIRDSDQLLLIGHGFKTIETAQETGEQSRDNLTIAFALIRFPADFGERAAKSHFTEYGLKWLEGHLEQRALNDFHGLQVYETRINPKFVSMNSIVSYNRTKEIVLKAFEQAFTYPRKINEKKRLAFDLFSASLFAKYADARFILLMMALETLIEQNLRSENEQKLINQFIEQVKTSDIVSKESIIGGLNNLKKESIGTAGKRLAIILTDKYMDMNPEKFFTYCYELRGKLIHGNVPRPTFEEVGSASASLEIFTTDLIVKS